jgi:hypothetical protein
MWELVKRAQIMQDILSLNKPGCRNGMVLQVERTGEKMLVVKPMGRQVKVQRGYGHTPVTDLKAGEKIIGLPEEDQKQKTDPDPVHPFRQYPDKVEKPTQKPRSKAERVAPTAFEGEQISGEIMTVLGPVTTSDFIKNERNDLATLLRQIARGYLKQVFQQALDEVFGIDAEEVKPLPYKSKRDWLG